MSIGVRALIVSAVLLYATSGIARALTPEEARIQELQRQIEALEQQAAQFRSGIATERAKADSLKKEIAVLKGQIGQIEAQIAATGKKIDLTKTEIGQVETQIEKTREEMSRKRETVGRMVLFLEQRDHEDLAASLFKFTSLSDFLQQFHDLATIQDRLLGMIAELKDAKMSLERDQAELEGKQQELETLNAQALQRRQQLAGVKGERDRVLQVTKGQEAAYQKQLAEVEKQKAAFFKELRELELKVVSGGLYIVHIKAEHVPPRGTKLFSWPEDDYHLTQGYGMTKYAKRGAYGGAPHNGIDIAAGYGATIKSIGDGRIVANGSNSGWGNWVAVQHPNNMVSVYGHMSSLSFLKVGAQVKAGDVLGYEGTTGKVTGSHLHLSLYKEFFTYLKGDELYFNYFDGTVNPSDYL
ncbi:MAG: peptidoglycan DD-metalloendopeptidase family protein [Candidatus Yanofskybacteria bacterium]|nr:peptidoglycan DD-metalloendopeptidase family protein [Candidatus Yanofskybacteria bacterium]